MGVFDLFGLLGIGTAASIKEGMRRAAFTKDSVLMKQAKKRGSKFYYKDGKYYDVDFGLELKETVIPGYEPFFTSVISDDFVIGCYEDDLYWKARDNAKRMNKEYFVVNRMCYSHRHLYNNNVEFYIVSVYTPIEIYMILRYDEKDYYHNLHSNMDKFDYVVVKYIYQNTIRHVVSPIESFPVNKKWLTEMLMNSYISPTAYIDIRMQLINEQFFDSNEYNNNYIFHIMNNDYIDIFWDTIHGIYNRHRIEDVINYLSNSYNQKVIVDSINILKQVILEESIYYEESNEYRKNLVFSKLNKIEKDCDILNDILNESTYYIEMIGSVINDLKTIICLEENNE